jgi:exopolysaccharide biosynthesis polyprenyl glycosylphosphotransferase
MTSGIQPLVGEIGSFTDLCRAYGIKRIVVAFSSLGDNDVVNMIRGAERLQLKISIIPRLYEIIGHAVQVDEVEGMTVLGMRGFALVRSSRIIKRALDLAGSVAGLTLLAPLFALIALLVKVTSRGPVVFAQERIGRDHQPFRLYKFRTMYEGADRLKPKLRELNEADGIMFKIKQDPRVTPVGRILRRRCLDELPQLWNVVRGDMSLVGPRPLVPEENHYAIDWHRTRLDLRPGVTGPWQVLGRTRIPYKEMVRLDYLYVAEWSLWRDIKLIMYTLNVVVRGGGW